MEPSKRVYSGTIDTFSKIYKSHGVGGFTRGIVPCLLRAFPANGSAFVTYDTVIQNMNNRS
jgi:solute carrier family 25 carnitine/acylcarnitine transporter 20/29